MLNLNYILVACTLIKSTVYCFAGFTQFNTNIFTNNNYNNKFYGEHYNNPINENVAIDLSQFNNFTTFDVNKIVWEKKSSNLGNSPLEGVGYATSTSINEDSSFLVYGGQTNDAMTSLSHPFLNYNPQTNTWKSLPLPSRDNYNNGATMINLGNDSVLILGGTINNSQANVSDILSIFDYKKNIWINQIMSNGTVRTGHTATLTADGYIYIFGGIYKSENDTNFWYIPFEQSRKYDTKSLQIQRFNATGDIPSKRLSHTVTPCVDPNLLIVYGGVHIDANDVRTIPDTYYIYNIINNSFQYVPLTSPTYNGNTVARFGHFATTYSSRFLVLLFGFMDANKPADSISVLDIKNPFSPKWISNSAPSINNYNNNSSLPSEKIIPIAVCVCVAVVATIFGLFFYIRRKRKQKKAFVLEQQDPRKHNPTDTTVQENSSNYGNMIAKPYEAEESVTMVNNDIKMQSPNDKKEKPVKPFETYNFAKPDSIT
ncbi:unnamed protein product [Cunninghamella blakesleeana]